MRVTKTQLRELIKEAIQHKPFGEPEPLVVETDDLGPQHDWHPAADAEQFDPDKNDFVWNDDFTMFRVTPLSWHDDASYQKYQSHDPVE